MQFTWIQSEKRHQSQWLSGNRRWSLLTGRMDSSSIQWTIETTIITESISISELFTGLLLVQGAIWLECTLSREDLNVISFMDRGPGKIPYGK